MGWFNLYGIYLYLFEIWEDEEFVNKLLFFKV